MRNDRSETLEMKTQSIEQREINAKQFFLANRHDGDLINLQLIADSLCTLVARLRRLPIK